MLEREPDLVWRRITGELNLVGTMGSVGLTLLVFCLVLDRLLDVERLRAVEVDRLLLVAASNNSTIRRAIKRTANAIVIRILVGKDEALCLSRQRMFNAARHRLSETSPPHSSVINASFVLLGQSSLLRVGFSCLKHQWRVSSREQVAEKGLKIGNLRHSDNDIYEVTAWF